MGSLKKWYLQLLAVIFVLYTVDRFTKLLALSVLDEKIVLIPRFLELSFYANSDIAFVWGTSPFIQVSIMLLVMALVLFMMTKEYIAGNKWNVAWFGITLAGAFSNVLDRIEYGYVIDFIRVPFWSVFNLSDVYIVVGILAVMKLSRGQGKKTTT